MVQSWEKNSKSQQSVDMCIHYFTSSSKELCEINNAIFILQMKILRSREVKWLVQGHLGS